MYIRIYVYIEREDRKIYIKQIAYNIHSKYPPMLGPAHLDLHLVVGQAVAPDLLALPGGGNIKISNLRK